MSCKVTPLVLLLHLAQAVLPELSPPCLLPKCLQSDQDIQERDSLPWNNLTQLAEMEVTAPYSLKVSMMWPMIKSTMT